MVRASWDDRQHRRTTAPSPIAADHDKNTAAASSAPPGGRHAATPASHAPGAFPSSSQLVVLHHRLGTLRLLGFHKAGCSFGIRILLHFGSSRCDPPRAPYALSCVRHPGPSTQVSDRGQETRSGPFHVVYQQSSHLVPGIRYRMSYTLLRNEMRDICPQVVIHNRVSGGTPVNPDMTSMNLNHSSEQKRALNREAFSSCS